MAAAVPAARRPTWTCTRPSSATGSSGACASPRACAATSRFGSQHIRRYAEEKGYVAVFEEAGVELINPSCGACINAGPGNSAKRSEVSVSAINRNFPGRSGPGQVYLASPLVIAASALAGRIVGPDEIRGEKAA